MRSSPGRASKNARASFTTASATSAADHRSQQAPEAPHSPSKSSGFVSKVKSAASAAKAHMPAKQPMAATVKSLDDDMEDF